MIEEQDWTEAFKEIAALIKPSDPEQGIPEVNHVDLYHGQPEHAEEDYPWPSNSVFLRFNCESIETLGKNVQAMNMRVDVIYCVDLLADSYEGSATQEVALGFMKTCRKIHALLQGTSGKHFSSADRVDFKTLPAHPSLMVINQAYRMIILDYSAMKEYKEATITSSTVSTGAAPEPPANDEPMFEINL